MKTKQKIVARLKALIMDNRILYSIAMILLRKKPLINGLHRDFKGKHNTVVYPSTVAFVNCKVDISGNNNHVRIGDFCTFHNVTFLIRGDNNHINISKSVRFNIGGSLHIEDNGCLIVIGSNTSFEETHIAVTEPGSSIVIGDDCMFAYDIDLRTGDSHSIIDTRTNKRVNYARDIRIGDHVWVAAHCSILKGVSIKDNCIVATRSVLTKSFDQQGLILGGSPAKILKTNITWDRQRLFTDNQKVA